MYIEGATCRIVFGAFEKFSARVRERKRIRILEVMPHGRFAEGDDLKGRPSERERTVGGEKEEMYVHVRAKRENEREENGGETE